MQPYTYSAHDYAHSYVHSYAQPQTSPFRHLRIVSVSACVEGWSTAEDTHQTTPTTFYNSTDHITWQGPREPTAPICLG